MGMERGGGRWGRRYGTLRYVCLREREYERIRDREEGVGWGGWGGWQTGSEVL